MAHDIENLLTVQEALRKALSFSAGIDEDAFLDNEMMREAMLMQLVHIGEHGGKLSDTLKNRFHEVEWQTLKAARNFYIHQYNYVNWRWVWETVQNYLPQLKIKIDGIIETMQNEQDNATDQ